MSDRPFVELLTAGSEIPGSFELLEMAAHVDSAGYGLYSALVARGRERGVVVAVCANNQIAERLHDDLVGLLGVERCGYFPHWETLPFERVSPTYETVGRRQEVRHFLETRSFPTGYIVVTTIRSMLQRLLPYDTSLALDVKAGTVFDQEDLAHALIKMGYVREYQTESRGEFSVRGSIVDIFPPTASQPLRVDFFGDTIEEIRRFDPSTQRSGEPIAHMTILPARELVMSESIRRRASELAEVHDFASLAMSKIADGEHFDGVETWLPWLVEQEMVFGDLLGDEDHILLLDPPRLLARASDILEEESSLAASLSTTWGFDDADALPKLHLGYERALEHSRGSLTLVGGASGARRGFSSWELSGREREQLLGKIRAMLSEGFTITVCAESEFSAQTITKSFVDAGVVSSSLRVIPGPAISGGCIAWSMRIGFLSESDLTGRRRSHRQQRQRVSRKAIDFEAFEIGGYVVHDIHGVAKYLGMTTRTMGGVERDYLLLEYRGGDKIYVPSDQLAVITPYSGGEAPQLSRLGGSDWSATKARAKKAAQEVAQELIVLYQKRSVSKGHAYSPDSPWQTEMESLFPYELTVDQAVAVSEVKADMEKETPMDRLICGDVGFGKTEIALRAAFKAVQDGKQVAVLVPTTLLASQHFQTFSDRFFGQPVRVEMLSRFLTAAQARSVLSGVAAGSVDVVVGTHRLLGGDLKFANLGLLVVDEEQRFGVSHKESIKELSAGVDVLTLSATPIPRTLEMSLTGIRDLSLLHTPPAQRHPILTHVGEYDERAVSEAIRRELLRDGQVFFVHNRVKDIEGVAAHLRDIVPEARIAVAHGQMDEGTLEQVVIDFWEQKYDVLVCTTIIESGIDMPTVNTLVVDRADRLGLGQLHQLRGRVGRSGLRAYAYLFFPPDVSLSEEAFERLRTIGENTELGSGYRIAMRDLEIRGAGNLLGMSQSGHMTAVGYDLYVRLVQEAVAELKGEEVLDERPQVVFDLPVSASIPMSYIGREDLRLDTYRRLSTARSESELAELMDELSDRFGPPPSPMQTLQAMVMLRLRAERLGLTEISVKKPPNGVGSVIKVAPVDLSVSKRMRLRRLYPKAEIREATKDLLVPMTGKFSALEVVTALVDALWDEAPAT